MVGPTFSILQTSSLMFCCIIVEKLTNLDLSRSASEGEFRPYI